MKYLLDVSALLSLGVLDHEFHDRTARSPTLADLRIKRIRDRQHISD
jgi:hypothetical protein